jgi:hypothetical protein
VEVEPANSDKKGMFSVLRKSLATVAIPVAIFAVAASPARAASCLRDALNGQPGYYQGMILEQLASGRAERLYVEAKLRIATGSTRRVEGKLRAREREYRVIVDEDGKVVTSQHRWDERRFYDEDEAREAGRFARVRGGCAGSARDLRFARCARGQALVPRRAREAGVGGAVGGSRGARAVRLGCHTWVDLGA